MGKNESFFNGLLWGLLIGSLVCMIVTYLVQIEIL